MTGENYLFFPTYVATAMTDGTPGATGGGGGAGVCRSNEADLLQLMERTGYSIVQENGQRKYGGPPPDWNGAPPPKGSEVFVGKIPRDCFEDELVPVFESVGKIYEFRLMMDFSGSNRGYAFVMYTNPIDAQRAVKQLNNYEIRKSKYLGVVKSVDNCRLFVGGIPKTKSKEEILSEMSKVTEGVVNVILYSSVTDKTKSRGFAFVEYENHRAAAMARRKLIPGKIQLWGHEIAVDWAEPEPEVDEDTMSKVTVLYVRNLMLNTTEDQIRDDFNAIKEGCVEKVKKLRDFAFVHFRSREDAQVALETMDNRELHGSIIEVTWAKPVDKGYLRVNKNGTRNYPNNFTNTPYPYSPGQATGYENTCVSYNYPQPMSPATRNGIGPRSPIRGGGVRGRGAAGMRAGRGYATGYLRGGYRRAVEPQFIDFPAGMELVPINPYTLKPLRNSLQLLQEMCHKNNWGEPIFQLMSTTMQRDGSGDAQQLYVYKVTIPYLPNSPYNSSFPLGKLCRSPDEAKTMAAESVLMQLGVPVNPEGGESNSPLLSPQQNGTAVPYSQPGRPISGASYSSALGSSYSNAVGTAYSHPAGPSYPGAVGPSYTNNSAGPAFANPAVGPSYSSVSSTAANCGSRADLAVAISYGSTATGLVSNPAYVVAPGKLNPYEHGYFDGPPPTAYQVAAAQQIY